MWYDELFRECSVSPQITGNTGQLRDQNSLQAPPWSVWERSYTTVGYPLRWLSAVYRQFCYVPLNGGTVHGERCSIRRRFAQCFPGHFTRILESEELPARDVGTLLPSRSQLWNAIFRSCSDMEARLAAEQKRPTSICIPIVGLGRLKGNVS
jgi:hypothetical protein